MIKLAILCLIIALVAAILGFGGVAGTFANIAIWLFVLFIFSSFGEAVPTSLGPSNVRTAVVDRTGEP